MLKKTLVWLLIVALLPLSFVYGVKALSNLTVSASPNTVNQVATYTITFNTTYGVDTSHHITITFPSGFYVPATIPANTIRINGIFITSPINSLGTSLGTSIVLTPPQNVGTYCQITIFSGAGIKNPAVGGTYTISVSTDTSESPNTLFYNLSIQSAVSNVSVSVNPLSAGAVAEYWINFTPGIALNQNTDYIYIEFPNGSTIPSTIQCNLITVNGDSCTSITRVSNTKIGIKTPLNLNANYNVLVIIPAQVGIVNPPIGGTYTIKVSTSKEIALVDSNPYVLTGSSISNLFVSVSPDTAGTAANYQIQFKTGPSGALTTTSDWIKIEFPSGTVIPSNTSAGYISINGRSCTYKSVSGTTLTVYIPSSLTILDNSWVYIAISDAFGITNPMVPSNSYTIKVSTSKETIPAVSNTYSITGTSISNLNVSVEPQTRSAIAKYTFSFVTSQTGALSKSALDKIYIQFPSESILPSSISSSYVTVNGVACTSNITVLNNKLTILTPVNIGSSASVTVVISEAANIKNPSTKGTYTFKLSTTKDVVEVAKSISIVESTISKPVVQLTSYAVGDVVGLTITFFTGSGGGLTANSDTISIQFPLGFTLPTSIQASFVKVNNYQAISVSKSGNTISIKPSVTILPNTQVVVSIDKGANIKNPITSGSYKLTVYTSKETTPVESDQFNIVQLPKTTATVTPQSPNGKNGYYKTTPQVVLTATSPVDANPKIYYYIDSQNPTLYTTAISIPDGIHTLYFYAVDKFQNKEVTQSLQFKVDTTPPNITIASPKDGAVLNSKDVVIEGKLSENASLTINGATVQVVQDLSFKYTTTITGKTTFTFITEDVAGNVSQKTLTVSLDTTPPKLVVNKPKAFETFHTPYVDVEGLVDADAVNVYVNGQKVNVSSNYTFTYRVMLTNEGLNSIEVIAEDLASNQSKIAIPVNYVKKTKLVLQVGNKNAMLNDKLFVLDAPPKIVDGRTLVPVRTITETFGAEITWEPVFRLVIIKLQDKTIYLQIGVKYASLNGKKVSLDVAPSIISNYTYVPLRFIAEAFDASVGWDSKTGTITIIYPK